MPIIRYFLHITWAMTGVMTAQSIQTQIRVEQPRPLAELAQTMQQNFSRSINYEDCAYVHTDDIEDVTEKEVKPAIRLANPQFRLLVPRATLLALSLTEAQAKSFSGASTAALEAFNLTSKGSKYELAGSLKSSTFRPKSCRAAAGELKEAVSPLASQVNVPTGAQNPGQLLGQVLKELSATSGHTIRIGQLPLNSFVRSTIVVTSGLQSGHNAIEQIIGATLGTLNGVDSFQTLAGSYHLYFDPGLKVFMLNIQAIPPDRGAKQPTPPKPPSEAKIDKFYVKK